MEFSQILALGLYLAALLFVCKRIDLAKFKQEPRLQHLLFGSAAALFVLWLFRTGIYDGLNVHFLWLTACTLLLGFRVSIVAASLALLAITLLGLEDWRMLGVNGLFGVLAPIIISYSVYSLSFHKLPKHFFVYIFVCGFIGGMLGMIAKMGLLGFYYAITGIHDWQIVVDNYLILILLLLFPEGLLNGMSMTMLIIYKPKWVNTYHDKFYLNDK